MIDHIILDDLNEIGSKVDIEGIYKKKNNIFFQSKEFLNSCCAVYLKDKKKIFIIIRKNKKPFFIAPLYIDHKCGIKILKWISCEAIDYNLPIADFEIFKNNEYETNRILLSAIFKLPIDIIYFDKIPIFDFYKTFNKTLKKYTNSYIFDSYQNFKDFYLKTTHSKTRQTDKRKYKKMFSNGKAIYEKIYIKNENINLLINLIQKKYYFYKKKKIRTFNLVKLTKFYENISCYLKKDFKLVMHIMKKNEDVLSYIFGIEHKNNFYYLIPYTPVTKYYKLSPGRMHIKYLIEEYQVKNVNIDFTAGDEDYKNDWSNKSINICYFLTLKNFKGFYIYLYFIFYYRFRKSKILKKIKYSLGL